MYLPAPLPSLLAIRVRYWRFEEESTLQWFRSQTRYLCNNLNLLADVTIGKCIPLDPGNCFGIALHLLVWRAKFAESSHCCTQRCWNGSETAETGECQQGTRDRGTQHDGLKHDASARNSQEKVSLAIDLIDVSHEHTTVTSA